MFSDIILRMGKKEYCDIEVGPIEKVVKNTNFTDLSYLLIYGDHDDDSDLIKFKKFKETQLQKEDMKRFFDGFPPNAHPMAILSSMVTALSSYHQMKI